MIQTKSIQNLYYYCELTTVTKSKVVFTMAVKENDTAYAVRNYLAAHLNKSQTGCFLLEHLRRGTSATVKISNNRKLFKQFLNLLDLHPTIKLETLYPKDGIGEPSVWVSNRHKHRNQPYPGNWISEEEYNLSTNPLTKKDDTIQITKYDAPPTPSPVVYATQEDKLPNAFAVLRDTKVIVPTPDAGDIEQEITSLFVPGELEFTPVEEKTQEKEPVKMDIQPVNAAAMMRTAKEMIAVAERMEKIEKIETTFNDIRDAQLEVARNSVIITRLNEELLEASDNLAKASERLRVLVQGK